MWIYLLKSKADVAKIFPQFKEKVELQLGCKIKAFQSDGGGEFTALKSFLDKNGIHHQLTCPYTPEQNGIAERKNRHIIESALSMMSTASLPMYLWDETFLHATHLINRLPTPLLNHKSPYESLFGTIPDYSSLKTFGCTCFPHLRPYNSNKLEYRSAPCTFLGYSPHHKGYKCLSDTGRIYTSRHVVFNEFSFPFASKTNSSPVTSFCYCRCSSICLCHTA